MKPTKYRCLTDKNDYVTASLRKPFDKEQGDAVVILLMEAEDYFLVALEKKTAIKFAKKILTEANKIAETEVENG